MDLIEYFALGEKRISDVAEEVGVPPSNLSAWMHQGVSVPARRAVLIEVATGGRVKRWNLRPHDWYELWPELVELKGAPYVPKDRRVM